MYVYCSRLARSLASQDTVPPSVRMRWPKTPRNSVRNHVYVAVMVARGGGGASKTTVPSSSATYALRGTSVLSTYTLTDDGTTGDLSSEKATSEPSATATCSPITVVDPLSWSASTPTRRMTSRPGHSRGLYSAPHWFHGLSWSRGENDPRSGSPATPSLASANSRVRTTPSTPDASVPTASTLPSSHDALMRWSDTSSHAPPGREMSNCACMMRWSAMVGNASPPNKKPPARDG